MAVQCEGARPATCALQQTARTPRAPKHRARPTLAALGSLLSSVTKSSASIDTSLPVAPPAAGLAPLPPVNCPSSSSGSSTELEWGSGLDWCTLTCTARACVRVRARWGRVHVCGCAPDKAAQVHTSNVRFVVNHTPLSRPAAQDRTHAPAWPATHPPAAGPSLCPAASKCRRSCGRAAWALPGRLPESLSPCGAASLCNRQWRWQQLEVARGWGGVGAHRCTGWPARHSPSQPARTHAAGVTTPLSRPTKPHRT